MEAKEKRRKSLEGKVWYRFIKVIFIVALLLGPLVGIGVFYDSIPKRQIDDAVITCDNGRSFSAREKGVYVVTESLSNYDKQKISNACNAGIKHEIINERTGETKWINFEELAQRGITAKNIIGYKIDYTYKTEGGWKEAILSGIGVALIGVLSVIVIKKTILYILIGGRWWKL